MALIVKDNEKKKNLLPILLENAILRNQIQSIPLAMNREQRLHEHTSKIYLYKRMYNQSDSEEAN